jgi:hypothetical protein
MSLQFGSITFTDPVKLSQWRPASGAGLYCICLVNQQWQPIPFQPIFFGVASNLADIDLLHEQVALESWSAHANSPNKLLVAHAHLPHFSEDQLSLFEQQLIARYEPPCNLWDRLPEFLLPEQHRNDVLAKYDRSPSEATQSELEKNYA